MTNTIQLKFDAGKRIVTGTATTPRVDAEGQSFDPMGAQFTLPGVALHLEHGRQIGPVTSLKVSRNGIKFKGEVTDAAALALLAAGRLRYASVAGTYHKMYCDSDGNVSHWNLLEISLTDSPQNVDAKVTLEPAGASEKGPAVYEPESSVGTVIIPSANEEQSRIADRLIQIKKALKQLERKAYTAYADLDAVEAINGATKRLEEERKSLLERSVAITSGFINLAAEALENAQASRQPSQPSAWAWEVRHLPEPEYPKGARQAGDTDRLKAVREQYDDFYVDGMNNHAAKHGLHPGAPATTQELIFVRAMAIAASQWEADRHSEAESRITALEQSHFLTAAKTVVTAHDAQGRITAFEKVTGPAEGVDALARVVALEQRLAEVEKTATVFRGVFQRVQSYPARSLVTSGGSLWIALKDVPAGIVPGADPASWQLAAKGDAR